MAQAQPVLKAIVVEVQPLPRVKAIVVEVPQGAINNEFPLFPSGGSSGGGGAIIGTAIIVPQGRQNRG